MMNACQIFFISINQSVASPFIVLEKQKVLNLLVHRDSFVFLARQEKTGNFQNILRSWREVGCFWLLFSQPDHLPPPSCSCTEIGTLSSILAEGLRRGFLKNVSSSGSVLLWDCSDEYKKRGDNNKKKKGWWGRGKCLVLLMDLWQKILDDFFRTEFSL